MVNDLHELMYTLRKLVNDEGILVATVIVLVVDTKIDIEAHDRIKCLINKGFIRVI